MGVTPLIGLTVFGYLFLIATCLTLWAALTLRDGRRAERGDVAGERLASQPRTHLGERPVWRADERGSRRRGDRLAEGRVESVPLRLGLPEVEPPDPSEGTGRVRVVPSGERDVRREPGRTITAKRLVVDETRQSPGAAQQRGAREVKTPATRPDPDGKSVSNDDVRGAKVVVKQRTLEDAFDRFLEVDRKDRGF